MERYLSITEMARRRNVTTETLRYYDRVGLLKPDYLDRNRVRYYSVLKYEQLETIKELQQLGLDLKEIAQYLADRRLDTSYDLLLRQRDFCEEQIRYYRALAEKINRKATLLAELKRSGPALMQPALIELEERVCLYSDEDVRDEISLGYTCMELESKVKQQDELAPIYGSDCYAGQFALHGEDLKKTRLLFLLPQRTTADSENADVLPAGVYLSLYTAGSFWERETVRECFDAYAAQNGLRLSEEGIVISKIDYSITDLPEERLYEFQVQVLPEI